VMYVVSLLIVNLGVRSESTTATQVKKNPPTNRNKVTEATTLATMGFRRHQRHTRTGSRSRCGIGTWDDNRSSGEGLSVGKEVIAYSSRTDRGLHLVVT